MTETGYRASVTDFRPDAGGRVIFKSAVFETREEAREAAWAAFPECRKGYPIECDSYQVMKRDGKWLLNGLSRYEHPDRAA